MKTWLMLGILFLSLPAASAEFQVLIGMPEKDARATMKILGKDVTGSMDMESGAKNGRYWVFKEYKAALAVEYKDGKVAGITAWALKDFEKSKLERSQTELVVSSITFNEGKKTYRLDK